MVVRLHTPSTGAYVGREHERRRLAACCYLIAAFALSCGLLSIFVSRRSQGRQGLKCPHYHGSSW